MKTTTARSLRSLPTLLLVWGCSSVSLLAQTNQTITGNLSVVGISDFGGNPDFNGNSLSFGSRNAPLSTTPGAIWTYADGTTPQITWSANQTGLTWLWHSGTSPQFRVDGTNTLGLFVPGATTPAITLNPAGPSTFAQGLTVTGAFTASGGLSSSGGTVNGGATGLTLNSGGTNQNIILTPNGTGVTTTARPLRVTNNTTSTSSSTGALTVAGGLGVAGALNVGATSSTARLTVAGTSNTNAASAANFTDSTGNSLLLVRNDGNVGIGTATPSTKLQVKGGAIQQITAFDNWSGIYLDAVSDQPKVGFRVSDNSERFRVAFQGVNTASERLAFVKTLSGENEVLSVLATGNVGIGTTAPVSRLTLAGGGNPNPNTGAEMDYVGQNLTFRGVNAGGTFTLGGVKMVQPNGYFVDAADMVFSTASGGVLNEVLRINRGGNVGIGTKTPSAKLDVTGDAKVSGTLSVGGQAVVTANQLSNYATTAQVAPYAKPTALYNNSGTAISSVGTDGKVNFASGLTAGLSASASGSNSTAIGGSASASGNYSSSIGHSTNASGLHSTAMGTATTASGYSSTTMGFLTTASGDHSTAMGYRTTANAYGSTVIGMMNVIRPENNPSYGMPTNDLFVIGNGYLYNNEEYEYSNAFSVKYNGETYIQGNLGIGTPAPTAKLEVSGDAKVTGTLTVGGQPVVTANQLGSYVTTAQVTTQLAPYATATQVTTQLGNYQLANGSGAGLTALNADQLTTGSLPPARVAVGSLPLSALATDPVARANHTGTQPWSTLTATPTTVSGYGITDALTASSALNADRLSAGTLPIARIAALSVTNDKLATNPLARANHTGTQVWSTITNTPTTVSGYGITDAVTKTATGDVTVTGATTLQGATSVTAPLTINAPVTFVNSNPAHRVTGLRVEPAGDIPMLTP